MSVAAAREGSIGEGEDPVARSAGRGSSYALLHSLYVVLNCLADGAVDAGVRGQALEDFLGSLPTGEETVLSASGHAITWNGERVGLESRSFVAVESILEFFAASSIGGLVLGRDATEAEVEAVLRTIAIRPGAETTVASELIRRGVRHASVLPPDDSGGTLLLDLVSWQRELTSEPTEGSGGDGGHGPTHSAAVTSDLRSVYVATLLLDHIDEVRLGGPRLAKSIIKCVADALLLHPDLIDLLAVIQESDADLVRHGALVAVYSALIGRRIGLPTQLLIELGVAALFHDVGRLDSQGGEDSEHTRRGFERFLGFEPCALSLRAMLVARRHHDPVDDAALSQPGLDHVDLFSAIVHVADLYERAVCEAESPEAALDVVRSHAESGDVPWLLVDALTGLAASFTLQDEVVVTADVCSQFES